MIFTLVSKVLGLFREVTLSFFYGTSNMSDIYLIALTIPTVIFSFVGIGLITTYMPVYTEVMQRDGKDAANKLTSNLINCVILICTICYKCCISNRSHICIFSNLNYTVLMRYNSRISYINIRNLVCINNMFI